MLGTWIASAKQWANASDAPEGYLEWQARSQVSTWWPVAPADRANPKLFDGPPILDDYANKHWNGLIRDFYAKRVQCFVEQARIDLPAPPPQNATTCTYADPARHMYLAHYPPSLVPGGGDKPPVVWPCKQLCTLFMRNPHLQPACVGIGTAFVCFKRALFDHRPLAITPGPPLGALIRVALARSQTTPRPKRRPRRGAAATPTAVG